MANKKENKVVYLNKKYRKKESKQVIFVISISLSLFLLSLSGSLFKLNFKNKIPVISVVKGSVDTSSIIKGVIIRKEHVYKSEKKGEINHNVAEKEKIKKDQIILNIEDKNKVNNLKIKEKKISKTIYDIQEQREEISAFSSDISNINSKIKSLVNNNIHKFSNSDMKDIYSLKNNIDNNINYKNNILLNEDRGVAKEYIDENIKIQREISKNIYEIKAKEGGILSYKIDGFEDIFNFKSMNFLSKEQTNISVNAKLLNSNIIDIDEPVFKIIESNKWYLCAYIPNKLTENLQEDKEIDIYIYEENIPEKLKVKVHKIIKDKKESYIILESTKKIIDYIDKRNISFKICDNTFTGLKLPKSSIAEQTFLEIPKDFICEDKIGKVVYKKTKSGIEKIYISIKNIKENTFYIISNNSNLFVDDIIINKENKEYKIEEEIKRKGVFKVNNGIANFVPIEKENIIYGEKDYIIISLDNNVGKLNLNIYDRIISDIENYNIVEGQKIN